jgi:hypothetical protein
MGDDAVPLVIDSSSEEEMRTLCTKMAFRFLMGAFRQVVVIS